ncbi:MAG: energy transducer TonB [Salinibacter sp.]
MHSHGCSDTEYRQRVLAALAGVLTVALLLVHGWPTPTPSSSEGPFRDRATERIPVESIQPTSQPREQSPPPPAPLPPVVVPNDVIVDQEIEFEDGALQVERPSEDADRQEGDRDPVDATRQPDTGARLLRNVQPKYPSAARDDDIRARVRVEVSVSAAGRVDSATVLDRWRVSEDGQARPVAQLGYGLEDAALSAAQRSLFRPARHEGRRVATRTTLTFTFGN